MRSIFTSLVLPVLLYRTISVQGMKSWVDQAPAFAAITPNRKALEDLKVEQKSQAGMTNLRFQASANYATHHPVTYRPGLAEFFFREENRNMLLAGSSHNRVQTLRTPNVELYRLWEVEAAKNRVARPSMSDDILLVTTSGISFLGLDINTIATIGCKKVLGANPELQITLICDELEVQGPGPLVWVFNQLTGSGNKDMIPQPNLFPFFEKPRARGSERSTHSSNSITADNTENGVVFRSVVQLTIDVSFPTLLLNALPVSKQMAEQQGSKAVLQVIERDIGPSLEALCKLYENTVTPDY
jgi:hypothetical protein